MLGSSQLLEALREALRDRYLVESEIGRGGMATVFVAEDLKHGRRVAIKVLTPEMSSSIDFDRFRREIQIAARLSHPHILPVFDSGEAGGLLYYTMPFVEGESLRARLKRESQLAIDDAIAIACEVADALSYAHAYGVVHRDIKPENVLLHGGHAVVADFGIARVLQDAGGEKLTQTGLSIGTAAYMSPEQFSGVDVDGRSDEYSLACMVYEMLVGEVPFTGPNAVAIMARHTMELPPSIQIVRGTVPDELEGAIMRALEKVPADRFATVAQFKEALLGQGATSTYARRTRANTRQMPAPGGTGARLPGRRRALVGAIAGVLAIAVGAFAARDRLMKPRAALADAVNLRHIAVRYFEDETRDSAFANVADGLTESLIAQLARVDALDVVSSAGVAPFRDPGIPDDSVGKALGVGTIVRGEVREDGDGLRVTVKLVDGETGGGLLGRTQTFRVPKSAFLSARDSVARSVSDMLRQQIGREAEIRQLQMGTSNGLAWTLLQRADNAKDAGERFAAAGQGDSSRVRFAEADSLARLATAADAAWTEPFAERAAVAFARARLARDRNDLAAAIDTGIVQADAALALDPRDARALELRGVLRQFRVARGLVPDSRLAEMTLDSAERDLNAAVQIAPRQATAWNYLSMLQYTRQNTQQANYYAQKAYEADAFLRAAPEVLWRLWSTSYDLEQFPAATRWCSEGFRRFPADSRFTQCRLFMMLSKAETADPARAWALASEIESRAPAGRREFLRHQSQFLVAMVLARAGLADSARAVLARARAGADVDPRGELPGYEALTWTFLGDRERAISTLEQYLSSNPEHRAGFAKVNAWWWRDLQNEPRFKVLAASGR